MSFELSPSKTLPIGLHGRGKLKLLITERMDEDPAKAVSAAYMPELPFAFGSACETEDL